jgi:hypothetical protein
MNTKTGHEARISETDNIKPKSADVLLVIENVMHNVLNPSHGALARLGTREIMAVLKVERGISLNLKHNPFLFLPKDQKNKTMNQWRPNRTRSFRE